jgi:MoaA/NifB/PqqE/SkfB family radical SAM enzyme
MRKTWLRYKFRNEPKLSLPGKKYILLRIEGTNKCNSHCVFCAHQFVKSEIRTLDFELYKTAIDQFVAAGGTRLTFTPVVGESLLDKFLLERMNYAKKYPEIEFIEAFTNGILLTRKVFEDLVDAGLTHLFISVSGFERAQYKQIFRNPFYDKLINNLLDIALSDRFSKCHTTLVIYTNSLFPAFSRQYRKFKSLGFNFQIHNFVDSWNGKIKKRMLPGFMYVAPQLRNHSSPCLQLFNVTIRADGTLTQCGCRDVDHDSVMTFGNIKDTSLYELVNNGTWRKLDLGFYKDDVPNICKKCTIPLFGGPL